MVATGPMPGSTPISVPTNTPTKQASRFPGASATARPYPTPCRMSTGSAAPQVGRQPHLQPAVEHEPRPEGHPHRGAERDRPTIPRDHPEQERQERSGHHHEADTLEEGDIDHERADGQ